MPRYYGYVLVHGRYDTPEVLDNPHAVERFLREHLYDEEVRITGDGDRLVFRALDGVDVFSRLSDLGIDLPQLYRDLQAAALSAVRNLDEVAGPSRAGEQDDSGLDEEPPVRRAGWEVYYDSIGLSLGEITMRQRAKAACRAAETVADVARLLRGTYFDASFQTDDGTRQWGYFHGRDCYAIELTSTGDGGWTGHEGHEVALDPGARVRYVSSGEDIHLFVLLDPPAEAGEES